MTNGVARTVGKRGATYGTTGEALSALQHTRKSLANAPSGAAMAAKEILRLLDIATIQGLLEGPATAGHIHYRADTTQFDAEFGSMTSNWRINGAISETPAALSLTRLESKNGNNVTMLHIRLPYAVKAFGREGREFKVNLFQWQKDGRLEIQQPDKEDFFSVSGGRSPAQYVKNFLLGAPTPRNWNQVRFVRTATSVVERN